MNKDIKEPTQEPIEEAPPSLWTDRSRAWIVGLIFMLMAGNVFFQIQAYLLGGGLILPVLAGQIMGVFIPLLVLSRKNRWNPVLDLKLGSRPWQILMAVGVLAFASLVPASMLAEISLRLFPADPERIAMFQEMLPSIISIFYLMVFGRFSSAKLFGMKKSLENSGHISKPGYKGFLVSLLVEAILSISINHTRRS